MIREPYHEEVVKAILSSLGLRQSCLRNLSIAVKEIRTKPRSRHSDYFNQILNDSPPNSDDPNIMTFRISMYSLHSITKEISFSPPGPRYENAQDSVVYCCLRLVLAPLIERKIFYRLIRGYHEISVSYNPNKFSDNLIDRLADFSVDPATLVVYLEKQLEERDQETEELVKIVKELYL
jgi:hypothetical protein